MHRFRLLGPVEIVVDGVEVEFARRQHRDLLALMLVHANRPLTVERIVDDMWGGAPPATAKAQVANMISAVRRALAGGAGARLTYRHGGYRLEVPAELVDLAQFEALTGQARTAPPEEAARLLQTAVDLWRGPALVGVQAAYAATVRTALEERRLAAIEDLHDAELRLGRHAALVPRLTEQVAAHPFRERPLRQLMIALYRCGRQAEALAAYRDARRSLAEEHGLEPSAELRELETLILRADPILDGPSPPAPVPVPPMPEPAAVVPRQLPAPARHFVGRAAALKDLTQLVDDAEGGAVVVAAVAGTGGIGKTAMAVHWAHSVADRFPDGQLYANLRGFDPGGESTGPAEAVRAFLSALGVPPQRVPDGLDVQAALYRSLLAGRRVLVVLDNARDSDQVRPLLPGTGGCLVLVTSRNRLTGLLADGAHHVGLDLLTDGEAHDLLARHLGPERVAADPAGAGGMVAGCARLPLALSIVAARAAAQPTFPLTAFAAELSDAHRRLDALDTHDPSRRLRSAFSWSYRQVSEPAARLFRLLGLHPGPDVSTPAAASLAGASLVDTRRALAELTEANLLTEHTPDRYALHDLLRAYAIELGEFADTEADRRAAVDRVLGHYIHTGHSAVTVLNPLRGTIEPDPPPPGTAPERPTDYQQAMAWFAAEHRVILAAVGRAAEAGLDRQTWQLCWTIVRYLELQGYWHDVIETQHIALAAGQRLADLRVQAQCRRTLGRVHNRFGRVDDALSELAEAVDLAREAGDGVDEAYAHLAIGRTFVLRGDYETCLEHVQRALDLFTAAGHRRGQAQALDSLGWLQTALGHHDLGLRYCEDALRLHEDLDYDRGVANALDNLGLIHLRLGDHARAVAYHARSLDLLRTLGDRYSEATTLSRLGDAHAAAGDAEAARTAWQQALAVFREFDVPNAEEVRAKLDR